MKRFYALAVILFSLVLLGCSIPERSTDTLIKDSMSEPSENKEAQDTKLNPEETLPSIEPEKESKSEEYKWIDDFILKYNTIADSDITDVSIIDVTDYSGGHYNKDISHTFVSNSIRAKFGFIGDSNIEIISYYTTFNSSLNYTIRLNCNAKSKEDFEHIISVAAKILDESLTDEDIKKLLNDIYKYTSGSQLFAGKVKIEYERDSMEYWFEMETEYASE